MTPSRRKVHFIGIGGVGMSALAQILISRGDRVSGSDPQQSSLTERLKGLGATVYTEQVAENIRTEKPDVVVFTAAIPPDNPELAAARDSSAEVVPRAEMLGLMMAGHAGPRIAVAGTHGKTTTTSMLASILIEGGMDPTVLIGGEYAGIGGNVRVGRGGVFVTEACEAYDSFLKLHPDIAVITNIEADHLDYYKTEERVIESFRRFASQVSGRIVWAGEKEFELAGTPVECRIESPPNGSTGFWATDAVPKGAGSQFTAHRRLDGREEPLGTVRLQVPGRHNVVNALAALAAGMEARVSFEAAAKALGAYSGLGRRFEMLADSAGIVVVDDYAHHPTEIRATLNAARLAYPERRIVTLFQPHLYSRTRDFLSKFADALSEADAVVVTDIYAAREKPIPGVRAADLIREIAERAPAKTVLYVADKRDAPGVLNWIARPGDLVLVMGAGDIRGAAEAFADSLLAAK